MDPQDIDPQLYKRPAFQTFWDHIDALKTSQESIGDDTYLALAREALAVKKLLPDLRADIAYEMVIAASMNDWPSDEKRGSSPVVSEIADLFADLEIPDAHVVTEEAYERGDFSEVQQKWDRIEELLGPSVDQ